MQEQANGFVNHHGFDHHTATFNLIPYPPNYNQLYLNQDNTQQEPFDEVQLDAALRLDSPHIHPVIHEISQIAMFVFGAYHHRARCSLWPVAVAS
jgi:hypothetical protein